MAQETRYSFAFLGGQKCGYVTQPYEDVCGDRATIRRVDQKGDIKLTQYACAEHEQSLRDWKVTL